MDILSDKSISYTGMAGIDYMKRNFYFLSSSIGYLSKGGSNKILIANENGFSEQTMKINWNYIHINTTFRLKTPSKNFYFFLGAGPKIEILLDNKYEKRTGGYDIKLSPFLYGIIGEIGIAKKINTSEIGLIASYNTNLNKFGNSRNGNNNTYSYALDNHNFLITLFLGIDLSKF